MPGDRTAAHRISVIIPAYNEEPRIAAALASLATQTRPPDEVIVVDDGSRDRTSEVVAEWTDQNDLPVRLIRQENAGISVTRNRGIRESTGDLIALLDADDLVLSEHLETLEAAFNNRPDLILCFADVLQVEVGQEDRGSSFLESKDRLLNLAYESAEHGLRILDESPFASLISGSYVPVSTSLFTRKAAASIGFFDEGMTFCEDRDFWLRLSRKGGMAYYPFPLAKKRTHDDNVTHPSRMLLFKRYQLKVIDKMISQASDLELTEEESEAAKRAGADSVNGLLYTSSRESIRAYFGVISFLLEQRRFTFELFAPKHLARALAATMGILRN